MSLWGSSMMKYLIFNCAKVLLSQKCIIETSIDAYNSALNVLRDWDSIDKQLDNSIELLQSDLAELRREQSSERRRMDRIPMEIAQLPISENHKMLCEEIRTIKHNIEASEKDISE